MGDATRLPPSLMKASSVFHRSQREGKDVYARRSANKLPRFQRAELSRPNLSPFSRPAVSLPHLVAGKGRMASDRCGGGGRSSGTGLEGVTSACPGTPALGSPPAVGVDEDWARASYDPRPRRRDRSETTGTGLRLGLNRAAYRTRTDNGGAERSASSKRYIDSNTPDVVRRSATLSNPSAGFRVSMRDRAREHLPPPGGFAACPPPEGAEDARTASAALFPLWGKTTAKRSVGGKSSPHRAFVSRPHLLYATAPRLPEDPWPVS
jgi:hypothetical protein